MVNIIKRSSWWLPERAATPEALFLNRRAVMGGGSALLAGLSLASRSAQAEEATLPPFQRNEAFKLDRPLTPEAVNAGYNNFYEYTTSKRVNAEKLRPRPWRVTVDGLCAKPFAMDIDDLIKAMPIEERLYRHRCVEAWSMTIPWVGFPLAELVKRAEPSADAKFLRMETFKEPAMAPGQKDTRYPWPYIEGLTVAEAMNDLAFLAVGAYGKIMPKQHGAPIRLAVPWKYGFKSIKSIVKFSFVKERPVGLWEEIQPSEYGFWANVNPKIDHPRWSQATEEVIATGERVPTQLFNGYAEQVVGLYKGLEKEALYM
jgi:sulfoxide reductase catalytic subunit YedY